MMSKTVAIVYYLIILTHCFYGWRKAAADVVEI